MRRLLLATFILLLYSNTHAELYKSPDGWYIRGGLKLEDDLPYQRFSERMMESNQRSLIENFNVFQLYREADINREEYCVFAVYIPDGAGIVIDKYSTVKMWTKYKDTYKTYESVCILLAPGPQQYYKSNLDEPIHINAMPYYEPTPDSKDWRREEIDGKWHAIIYVRFNDRIQGTISKLEVAGFSYKEVPQ